MGNGENNRINLINYVNFNQKWQKMILIPEKIKTNRLSLLPTPYSLLLTPYSLLPTPYS